MYLAIGQDKQKVLVRVIQTNDPYEALRLAKQTANAMWDIYPIDSNKPVFAS